nr:hypothetical protein [Tanacetum cinerariifolium]
MKMLALGLNDESVKKLRSAGISTCSLFVKHPKEAVTAITGLADDKASEILEAAKKLVKTSGDDLLIEQQEHFVFVKGFSKKTTKDQLETAVNTIFHEYLLEFTSEYGIPETLHPVLPGPEDRIVDFPEGKIGVYTRFFEFANFRFPLSQFLFDVLGYYPIHLSQLSVIGAAKVSHFEINFRVLNVIPTLSLFRVFYTPSFNLGWMSFNKRPGRNTPQCYTKPWDSLKNWNNRFFWFDERVFLTVMDWRTNALKDGMPAAGTYSLEAVRVLDTHRTPIQKQPEMLLCLVGISRRYYLGDEAYPIFLHDDDRDMDLFNLIRASNPTKVKVGSRPRAPHEVPLLTLTAPRVNEMDEPAATDSSGVPSTIERSPLDFAHEAGASNQGAAAPEIPSSEDVPATVASGVGQTEETATMDP